jgi:hypothetical protein
LGENLRTHEARLFPKIADAGAKAAFGKAFKSLMYNSFNDAEEAETTFDIKWRSFLAIVAKATPCPAELKDAEYGLNEDDGYDSCEAGAYTRPLTSSTYAVLDSEPPCVLFVTSFDPSTHRRYPTCPTKSA